MRINYTIYGNARHSFSICVVASLNKDKMANIANISAGKSSKNQGSFEVITLSSDEEQSEQSNEDVSFLFKRFILACRPHLTKEAIKDARSLFVEVQGKLTASHDVVDMLKRYSKETKKENADLYLNMICNILNEEKSRHNSVQSDSINVGENLDSINKVAKSVTFCDVSGARGFETNTKIPTNQNTPTTSTAEVTTISDDDDFVSREPSKKHTEKNVNMPSTSNQHAKLDKSKGKISTKTLTEKQKKKLVVRLKQRLKEISNEIKILDRAELTLDEMDMSDSLYIQENRLKKKFEKTWNKLCKLLGRLPNTGRVVEKPIRASSTGYSMIDKAVAKFLKEKHNSFPDYFDIRDIVLNTNQKHDLRMSPQVLNGIIADIFTDIGNKLQRRRERDLQFNFGSHLLDDFKADDDPALSNEDLARQLEKNRRISKRNLKYVYAKYTHLERYEIDDKSRRGPSMVKRNRSSESGTSGDELDHQSSRNHKYARLDRREVMGKSKMKKGSSSTSGPSRWVDRDISSESSSSGNEQDLPRMENDDSIMVEDSDVTSSQEFSFVIAAPKLSTDVVVLSTSNVEQSLSETDQMEASLSNNERPESPTFPLASPGFKCDESGRSEQTVSTDYSNDDTRTKHTFSCSSDCEITSILNEQEQLVAPANKSLVSENQTSIDYDCEIVNEPTEQLITTKQLDESVNEPSVSDKQPNIDDCEIVDNPKQQLVTIKELNEPGIEPVNEAPPNTDDDCLIIDDEDSPTTSPTEPLKIPTSTHSDELTKTLNVLREVFQMRSIDQSKVPVSSCDETTGTRNTNSVSQPAPESKMKSLNLRSDSSNSVSQTDTSIKAWSSESSSDDMENLNAYGSSDPIPEYVTLVPDNDVIMSDNDQCSTSDALKDSIGISTYRTPCPKAVTVHANPGTSTSSSSPLKHSEKERNSQFNQSPSTETPSNVVNSITSNVCHSPSSKTGTSETGNMVVKQHKRKATSELSLEIPKSSVRYLEQIAWSLKNKRLKLPDAWLKSSKADNTSNGSLSKPTTSKESSTVSSTLSKPTSKASSAVSLTLSENNSQLINGKAKIDLQQRQVFREKTLNALKLATEPACNNNGNGGFQSADLSSSSKTVSNIPVPASDSVDNAGKREVIIIDD